MKTILRSFVLLFILGLTTKANSQNATYVENFESTSVGSVPPGWIVASNTDVANYNRHGSCGQINRGLQTPGVGKNSPTGFVLPAYTSDAATHDVIVKFSVYVYDANLNDCGSNKPFPCATYVNAYIVPTTWSDPLGTPTAGQYYAALPDYQLVYPNASNTVIFDNVTLPAGVTSYKILLNFKNATTSNCTATGTKFIFDDFGTSIGNCTANCAPIANQDYFNFDAQLSSGATALNGNVYGGYTAWASRVPAGFERSSLPNSPAIDGGRDYDLMSTPLSGVTFFQASALAFESGSACIGTPSNLGTLTFNSNGTFTYIKGADCIKRVSFTYYAKNNSSGEVSATAKVVIDLPGQEVFLPVIYKSINATRHQQNVLVTWQTSSEQNNRGFYVQRNTGSEWKDIAFVFSQSNAGTSSADLSYEYKDLNANKGVSYYRIRQVDLDGRTKFSENRSVRGDGSVTKLLIYPNPNSGRFTLMFNDESAVRDVQINDMMGRVVKQYKNVTGSTLPVALTTEGLYNVQVTNRITAEVTTEKIVIHK